MKTGASGFGFFGLNYLTLRTGNTNQVYLSGSGNLGIGTVPSVPLEVAGGTDASLAGGGFLVIGDDDQTNIVIDNNEIIARNDGGQASLHLNHDGGGVVTGGNLVVGGTLDIGYQHVTAECGGGTQNWCTATCPAGKKVIAGGCHKGPGGAFWPITLNYPDTTTSWHCAWQASVPNANLFRTTAVCASID